MSSSGKYRFRNLFKRSSSSPSTPPSPLLPLRPPQPQQPPQQPRQQSRFKNLFNRSSSSPSTPSPPEEPLQEPPGEPIQEPPEEPLQEPPQEPIPPHFHCPITKFPMVDPVVIPTGESFDRISIEACRELKYTPPELSSRSIDLSSPSLVLVPNHALKSAIDNWYDSAGNDRPGSFSAQMAKYFVAMEIKMGIDHCDADGGSQEPSFRGWLPSMSSGSGISEEAGKQPAAPPPSLSLAHQVSVADIFLQKIMMKLKKTPIPLKPPSSAQGDNQESSSAQASAESSESRIADSPADNPPPSSSSSPTETETSADPLEKMILRGLDKSEISEKESALANLIQLSKESPQQYSVSLCTPRILDVLIPMLQSPNAASTSVSVMEAIYAFSISPSNRIKIVECGAVPALADVLKDGKPEIRGKAASTIYNLAINEETRMAIGASGVIHTLLDKFSSRNFSCREEAGLALCYLVLCSENLAILANSGVVVRLLSLTVYESHFRREERGIELRKCAMVLLYYLAGATRSEDLMGTGIVSGLLTMLRKEDGIEEYCLAVLYGICLQDFMGFRQYAILARGEEVLAEMKETWEEDGLELARRMLEFIRGDYKQKKPMI